VPDCWRWASPRRGLPFLLVRHPLPSACARRPHTLKAIVLFPGWGLPSRFAAVALGAAVDRVPALRILDCAAAGCSHRNNLVVAALGCRQAFLGACVYGLNRPGGRGPGGAFASAHPGHCAGSLAIRYRKGMAASLDPHRRKYTGFYASPSSVPIPDGSFPHSSGMPISYVLYGAAMGAASHATFLPPGPNVPMPWPSSERRRMSPMFRPRHLDAIAGPFIASSKRTAPCAVE